MLRIKFLVIVVLGIALPAMAQYSFDFSCLDDTVQIATDTTTMVTFYFCLQNTGTLADSYAFDCRYIDSVPGWDEIYCVGGLCAQPGVILYDYLNPGVSDSNIDIMVFPNSNYGIEAFNLHVSSVANSNLRDSINVYVKKELAINEENKLSAKIGLEVHPNPFTQKIAIRYTIPDARCRIKNFSLRIYDISGQLIRDLTHNLTSCILHHASAVFWDGTDNSGNILETGVYFCRLETQNRVWIKKLVLLK